MAYDLVLKGARVIDPSQELDGIFDVGIKGDKNAVMAVSTHLVNVST